MLSPAQLLCFNLYAASHAFQRAYKPHLDPLGLTYPQFLVMVSLWQQDGQPVGALAEGLGLESSTLSPLIKRLAAAGLVTRARSGQDERRVIVTLTPQGRGVAARAAKVPECLIAEAGLTGAEYRRAMETIGGLRARLAAAETPIDARPGCVQEGPMLIYKILRRPEWDALRAAGETTGAPVDLADGYIHLSTAAQVAETAARHFAQESDLVLVAVSADTLGPALKWEPSRGGALFPHLYRPLRLADVVWDKSLPLGATGHIFPEGLL